MCFVFLRYTIKGINTKRLFLDDNECSNVFCATPWKELTLQNTCSAGLQNPHVAQGFSPAFRSTQKENVLKRLNKRPRLKNFDYKGCYRYFITICTYNRMPLFKDAALVNQLIKALRNKSNSFGFKVWTFCFMPDHLHLLLEGIFPNSDLKRFITSYKQYTGYHYKTHVTQAYKTYVHVAQGPKTHVALPKWQRQFCGNPVITTIF